MPRLPTPKEMRQRREGIIGYITTPKPRYDRIYRPGIGSTYTDINLLDEDRDFTILWSFHCPGYTGDNAPIIPSGESQAGIYQGATGKIGFSSYFESGGETSMGKPSLHNVWMGYGNGTPVFGWLGNDSPFSPAGGRCVFTHRKDSSVAWGELCGQSSLFAGWKGTFATGTGTMLIVSNSAVVVDLVAVYLDELTAEEEDAWRCYGILP